MENEYIEVVGEQVVIPNYKRGRTLCLKDFKTFLTRPAEFFNGERELGKTLYIIIIVWMLGIEHVINHIGKKIIKYGDFEASEESFMTGIMNSWGSYWLFVLGIGILSGIIIWGISGWWYNLRLKWCALQEIEHFNGRVIYSYNKLITVIPTILFTLIETLRFSSYKAAYFNDGGTIVAFITIIGVLFANVYSIINSYRSVTGVFKLKKSLARLWFLILPLALIGLAIVFLISAVVMVEV